MLLPALLVSDLHLVESPSCEYRWGLWPWLTKTIQEERVQTLVICGDITDKKDNHPSELVNRLVRVIHDLHRDCPGILVYVIPGNHDWLKGGEEFFRFLSYMPNTYFFTEPHEDEQPGKGPLAMFLPFTKTPAKDWKGLDFSHYDYVFMHQTVKGAISSNGQEMEGEDLVDLSAAGKVFSGDIHVPQKLKTQWGNVEYIGSPYHVHFGDDFKPRAVLLEKGGKTVDLHFKTIKRVSIKARGIDELGVRVFAETGKGDHVKATIQLQESEKHEWGRIRRDATQLLQEAGVEVYGLTLEVQRSDRRLESARAEQLSYSPEKAVLRFVQAESLTADAFDVAMEVIES